MLHPCLSQSTRSGCRVPNQDLRPFFHGPATGIAVPTAAALFDLAAFSSAGLYSLDIHTPCAADDGRSAAAIAVATPTSFPSSRDWEFAEVRDDVARNDFRSMPTAAKAC